MRGARFDRDAVEELLRRPNPGGRPSLLVPVGVQWQLAAHVTDTALADRVLGAPEFVDAVKLSVCRQAAPAARIKWLSRDPAISDGEFLLEALVLAQAGQMWATIDLLGNRPALSEAILDLELIPLFSAAARHSPTLEAQARFVEHVNPGTEWALPLALFLERTDVNWLLRNRARAEQRTARRRHDGDRVTATSRWWDSVTFAEAGLDTVTLDGLPGHVSGTRRAAAAVISSGIPVEPPVRAQATRVARANIVAAHVLTMSGVAETVGPVPSELIELIEATPLADGVSGASVGVPGMRPSVPPAPATARPDAIDPVERRPQRRPMIVRNWWG